MRRVICYSEPTSATAGTRGTWQFVVTPTSALPKGTLLKFDLSSKGRSIDWEIPQTDLKKKKNLIWAEIEGDKPIKAKAVTEKDSPIPSFEFVLPKAVPANKKISIYIGTPSTKEAPKNGTMVQQIVQRRRPFYLFIDPTGKKQYGEPELFTIDIRGGKLETIRILAPSVTVKNRRFDVVLRFEDKFGNLTNNAPEDTLIEFSHANLRETLKWKLFLPETGFITLPNLYFNEPGVYFLRLKNLNTGEEFQSAPVKCFASEEKHLLWGTLHGESTRFDAAENIENCLRHFRDEQSLNFFGTSTPDAEEETPQEIWKQVTQAINELDEDDRFGAFVGQQWTGEPKQEGTRIFVHQKYDKPLLRKKEARSSSLKKIYRLLPQKDYISIPMFTMASISPYIFEEFDPEVERVAEIYNAWGCSERTTQEGNPFPIKGDKKQGAVEAPEGSLLQALKNNRRFGFVAGGLDDRAVFASLYDKNQQQYTPGLTAVYCDRLNHNNIFEALYRRQCYATTGERIVVGWTLAGASMGSELDTIKKPGLLINRHIAGYVAGTDTIERIEIVRNGNVIEVFEPDDVTYEFTYDDSEELQKIALKDPQTKALFSFYYLRIIQTNGHMAWTSPIWIDCATKTKEQKESLQKKGTTKAKEPTQKKKGK